MKRPLACVGFGVLAASSTAALCHTPPAILAAVCSGFAAVLFCLRQFFGKNTAAPLVFMLSAAAAASVLLCADTFWREPIISKYNEQQVVFDGIITETPYTYGTTTFFTVKTTSINGNAARLNIKISTDSTTNSEMYDCVSGKCVLSRISPDDNCIDYSSYYNSRHIFLQTYVSKYDKLYLSYSKNDSPPFIKRIYTFRNKLINALFSVLSYDEASLCSAVLTGQRQYITSSIKREFRGLGIMHLLVVSGMHLAIAAGIVFTVTNIFIKNKYVSCAVRFSAVLLFAVMTGFGYPVRRALVIFIAAMLAEVFNSTADPLNTLGLAAIVLCVDPYAGGDIGLLWSFSAAAAQIIFGKRIYTYLCGTLKAKSTEKKSFVSLLSSSIAGILGSVPFVAIPIGVFSPYTLAANLMIIPVTGFLMLFSGVAAVTALISLRLSALPMLAAGAAARYVLWCAHLFANLPFSFVQIPDRFLGYCVLSAFALIAGVYIFAQNKKYTKHIAFITVGVTAIVFISRIIYNSDTYEIYIMNSQDGVTAVINTPYGYGAASCAGTSQDYTKIRQTFSQYTYPEFLIDTSQNGYTKDFGRKIAYEYKPDIIFVSDDTIRKKCYSWYEYCGGKAVSVSEDFSYNFDGGRIDVDIYDDAVCKLITLGSVSVMLCEGSSDNIPMKPELCDIAVFTNGARDDLFSGAQIIDLSGESSTLYIKIRGDGEYYAEYRRS